MPEFSLSLREKCFSVVLLTLSKLLGNSNYECSDLTCLAIFYSVNQSVYLFVKGYLQETVTNSDRYELVPV